MSEPALRIAYFTSQGATGTGLLARLMRQLGHEVIIVVMTPGPIRRPSLAYQDVTANPPLPATLLVTNDMAQTARMLSSLDLDVIVVTGFPRLLPPEMLALPRLGAINAHPALLPAYRGPDPIFWQFYNGEPELGLTIHRMDEAFDTGAILAQSSTLIGPDETPDDVFPRLFEIGAPLIAEALAKVIAGDPGTPQDPARASYAPLPTEADRRVDWNRGARQIHNQARACYGSGALATVGGEERLIHRTQLAPDIATSGVEPGDIIFTTEAGMLIQTGDGALLLTETAPVEHDRMEDSGRP